MAKMRQTKSERIADLDERSHRVFELIVLGSHLAGLRRALEVFHHDLNGVFRLPETERVIRTGDLLGLWSACQEPIIQLKQQADDTDYLRRPWSGFKKSQRLLSRIDELYRFSDEIHSGLASQSLSELTSIQSRFRNTLLTLSTLHQTMLHRESRALSAITNQIHTSNSSLEAGSDIFIIHGHDTAARESVARFLERLGLKVCILHEMANAGRTIIEKFEDYSSVGYAVALLTGDDEAHAKNAPEVKSYRARQNVVFELGYFIGKLGRARVCALVEDGVERPSDIDGLVYIPLDRAGGWKVALAQDVKKSGIDVDLNKIIEGAA